MIFIIIIFNVLAHFATLDMLAYLKKNFPSKYYDIALEKNHGLLSFFFPTGNPITMPIFLLSTENLGDRNVSEYKKKIRKYYLIALFVLLGLVICLIAI